MPPSPPNSPPPNRLAAGSGLLSALQLSLRTECACPPPGTLQKGRRCEEACPIARVEEVCPIARAIAHAPLPKPPVVRRALPKRSVYAAEEVCLIARPPPVRRPLPRDTAKGAAEEVCLIAHTCVRALRRGLSICTPSTSRCRVEGVSKRSVQLLSAVTQSAPPMVTFRGVPKRSVQLRALLLSGDRYRATLRRGLSNCAPMRAEHARKLVGTQGPGPALSQPGVSKRSVQLLSAVTQSAQLGEVCPIAHAPPALTRALPKRSVQLHTHACGARP